MTPQDKGRFCSACQKCVVDFTEKKPAEIAQIYQENNGQVCGRVKVSQLKQPARKPVVLNGDRGWSRLRRFAVALMLAFGFFQGGSVMAQTGHDYKIGIMVAPMPESSVSGEVKSSEGGAVEGARVYLLQGGEIMQEAVTDGEGRYQFNVVVAGEFEVYAEGDGSISTTKTVKMRQGGKATQHLRLDRQRMIMGKIAPVHYEPEPEIMGDMQIEVIEVEEEGGVAPESSTHEEIDVPQAPLVESGEKAALRLEDAQFTLYPNPSTDNILLITTQLSAADLEVSVVDLEGRLAYQTVWHPLSNPALRIETADFATGVYLVTIAAPQGDKVVRRFVKE